MVLPVFKNSLNIDINHIIHNYFILCIHVGIYTILIFTLKYAEDVYSLVFALPARLLVCTVQCNFASNVRRRFVSDEDHNLAVVLADYKT